MLSMAVALKKYEVRNKLITCENTATPGRKILNRNAINVLPNSHKLPNAMDKIARMCKICSSEMLATQDIVKP